MTPVEIPAGRLRLRPWRAEDAPAVLRAGQDPLVQRWTRVPVPYDEGHARAFVGEVAPAGWASGDDLTFAVCDSATGQVLASVASRALDDGARDVGYWALPDARGQGVVTEAMKALCAWLFDALAVPRVAWRAEVGNVASRRAAEKAGFTVEGTARRSLPGRAGLVDAWTGARLPGDPDRDTARLPGYPGTSDGVVRLRRFVPSDAADVTRACDDAGTARWLPVPSPYRLEHGRAYVEEQTVLEWVEGRAASVAVVDAVTGALLGACGLTLHAPDGLGEIGYWTGPEARGRGVAGRAAALHAAWALDAVGLVRLELLADVGNHASQRAAERAGFVREGVARAVRPRPRGNGRADMVQYAMVRPD